MRETNLFSRCSVSARLSIRHAAITTPASSAIHLRVRGRTQQQTLGSMIAAAGHRSPCRISAPAHASAECPPIHLRPRATGHVSFETLIAPGATSRPRNDAVREKTAHRFSRAGWRCLLRQRRTTVSTDLFNYSFWLELAHLGRSAKKCAFLAIHRRGPTRKRLLWRSLDAGERVLPNGIRVVTGDVCAA